MVPFNMANLHCLQHSLFEHLFNIYLSDAEAPERQVLQVVQKRSGINNGLLHPHTLCNIPVLNDIPDIPVLNVIPDLPVLNDIPDIPVLNIIPDIPVLNVIPDLPVLNVIPDLPVLNVIPDLPC